MKSDIARPDPYNFGMILGVFIGATVGELIAGKENSMALKAGMATFIGSIIAVFIRLSLSLVMAFYFFVYLFKGWKWRRKKENKMFILEAEILVELADKEKKAMNILL